MASTSIAATLAALSLCVLTACTTAPVQQAAPADPLADFPPLAAKAAPGASPAARQFAANLKRGVNFGNMLDAPTEGAWYLSAEDRFIDLVGAHGGLGVIDSVRLPVRWSNHASADAQARIDPAFMARVEAVVQRLLQRGVPVVMDMHHYRQLDGDALDAGETAVDDAVVERRFLAMWKQIAEHFRAYPPTLAFELYNEPHGRLTTRWNELASRALRVVRQSNPERIVVVGPTQWNSARGLATFEVPPDANLILTIHDYDPFTFTHQGAPWVKPVMPVGIDCCSAEQLANLREPLDLAQKFGKRTGYPVYLGEFGAINTAAPAARNRYVRAMRNEAELRGMSWAYWELAADFGFIDPKTGQVRPDGLEAALFGF